MRPCIQTSLAETNIVHRRLSFWGLLSFEPLIRSPLRLLAARRLRASYPARRVATCINARESTCTHQRVRVSLPNDPHVFELPRIAFVDVFGEEALAFVQRRPVRVGA